MFSLLERLSQELGAQIELAAPTAANATANATVAGSPGVANLGAFAELATIWRILSSFGMARDWIKLFVLGSFLETLRRFASTLWSTVIESFFLTATFESNDDSFNWIIVWLAKQNIGTRAREVQVSTSGWGIDIQDYSSRGIFVPGETDVGFEKRPLHFLPSFGLTQTCWYKHYWMRITRSRRALVDGDTTEQLTIRILTRSHDILNKLLIEAKQTYGEQEQHRVAIYTAGNYNDWRRTGSRPKRPLESIVLDSGLKERLLADAQEFLGSEKWYSERGLPYRRGYLFHGTPGSGKTSLISALCGALQTDLYIINLNKKGLDDGGLSELVSDLPARSVALIEEIDAVFTRGVNRETTDTKEMSGESKGVTLSGLLSSLDGIQASEGRLLFATTNKYHALDPALIRPGRLDVHVEFKDASQTQAGELFKRFYRVPERPKDGPTIGPVPEVSPWLRNVETLTEEQRDTLAQQFAKAIPDRMFSMAAIQGLLLNFKHEPSRVIKEVPGWIEKELEARRARKEALSSTGAGAAASSEAGQEPTKDPASESTTVEETQTVTPPPEPKIADDDDSEGNTPR